MKRFTKLVIAITIGSALAGCGATTKMIDQMSQGARTDVFVEISSEGPVPSGFAGMIIRASLKTPYEGYYPLESKRSAHGKAVYPFLVNIDDQAVLWQVQGRKHEIPRYTDGKTSRDPEAGGGMKYMLEKKVRLAAESHKVFFGLPDEPYYTTADISVKSGGLYVLEFKPDYRYKTSPTRIPTFLKGVDKFEVVYKEIIVQDH
jgi:hypothetical protein